MGRTMKRQMRTTTPDGLGRARRGFSLIEIMLALGVLGVGMVMVAAIFPAAIYQTRAADRTTHAILICENARAILTMKATHTGMGAMGGGLDVNTEFAPVVIDDPDRPTPPDIVNPRVIHADDAWYPTGPLMTGVNDRQGWVAMARRVAHGANNYQIVVIAYRKFEGLGYDHNSGTGKLI